jgi:hypothetical protein
MMSNRYPHALKYPHEGLSRTPIPNSHMVIIDLDANHVVVEVPAAFRNELPELGATFTLQAGDLLSFCYLKTPLLMKFLNSLDVRISDAQKKEEALDRDWQRIQHMIQTGTLPNGSHKCLLCSDEDCELSWVGMFWCEGDLAQRLGAKPGKKRGVLYLLCEDCYKLPDKEARIEQTSMSRAGVQ